MKIGVLVENTSFGDMNYHVIKELNEKTDDNEVVLFSLDISSMVLRPEFAIMSMSKVTHFYHGLLVATSLETAKILSKTSNKNRKVYYIYSMEWLYKTFVFDEIYDILHSGLTLVVRSDDQKQFLERTFNLDNLSVVEEFNLEKINGIC